MNKERAMFLLIALLSLSVSYYSFDKANELEKAIANIDDRDMDNKNGEKLELLISKIRAKEISIQGNENRIIKIFEAQNDDILSKSKVIKKVRPYFLSVGFIIGFISLLQILVVICVLYKGRRNNA